MREVEVRWGNGEQWAARGQGASKLLWCERELVRGRDAPRFDAVLGDRESPTRKQLQRASGRFFTVLL